MNNDRFCSQSSCPASQRNGSVPLKDTLDRFAAEAELGVCDTGRYRCSYFVWGQGVPLLFIPGLADDSRSFVQVAGQLASSFKCISYDLPTGRGDGARLNRYSHSHLAEDVLALLDHLGYRQSYIFGSSFGSTIALAAIRAWPERLPRAILQGGFARRELTLAEVLLARLVRFWPGTMKALPLRAAALRKNNQPAFAQLPPEIWEYFLSRSNSQPTAAAAHRALIVQRLDLRPVLAEIRQPVLLVAGDHDPVIGRSCGDVLLQGLRNARRVELVNCGHNPLFSHAEVLAELVRQFLTPPE